MKVLVTGGTGFIGAHSVVSLLDAGHEVKLFVRSPARIAETLGALGAPRVEYATGDICDAEAVAKAIEGCDAVLHCAAVVALARSRADEVLKTNARGAELVIGAAVDRGLDPIVHVSSTSALFDPDAPRLHSDLPPANAQSAYGRSKAAAEEFARRMQSNGAPVTITYPGGVAGPPAGQAFGELGDALEFQFKLGAIMAPRTAWSLIDVRDVGAIHAAVMEPGRGPRRYMCGGHFMTMADVAATYRELTGRRFRIVNVPGSVLRGMGRVMDVVTRVLNVDSVFTAEGMTFFTRWVPTDDRHVTDDLGIAFRDPKQTLADAVRGLYAAGRLSAAQVGKLAE